MPDIFDQAAKSAPKGDIFDQAATAEIPDATKQAQAVIRRPIEEHRESTFIPTHPYGGGGMNVTGTREEIEPIRSTQRGIAEMGAASAATAGMGEVPGILGWIMRGLASGGAAGGTHALSKASETGSPDLKGSAETGAGFAATEMAGEAGFKGLQKLLGKAGESTQRVNKLLGVKAKQVIPGKAPESFDAFVANPARGAEKYGLDEKALGKMTPLERNNAVMAARDQAGQKLEQSLTQAQGKQVNIEPTITKTFKEILDPKLQDQAKQRLMQIIKKNNIRKPLSQLTPMEARTIQRDLDDFAKFSGEGEAKSFGDIARQLRKGISEATRKAVPESAEFDQDYTDLRNASNATQNQLKEFARKAPENQIRKWIIKAAAAGAGVGGAYEIGKHFTTPTP